jgi:hypothetical protein
LINGIASFGRFSSDLSDNLHPTLTATMLVTGTLKHDRIATGVCTENLIRVDAVMESPKLAE